MEFLIGLGLAAIAGYFVTAPLREPRVAPGDQDEFAALEAAKESKYREIRDLELDRAAGKIGDEDFAAADAELRAEAVAILDRLDSANKPAGRR